MKSKPSSGPGKCKTCGKPIDASDLRCVTHQREFSAWLEGKPKGSQRTAYQPRFNGIEGAERNEEYRRRQRIAFAIVPGLRPEQPLKFD